MAPSFEQRRHSETPTRPANIFYLSFLSRGGWIHPLQTRLNRTSNTALRARYKKHWGAKDSELGILAVIVEAKLSKLPSVVDVLNHNISLINTELQKRRTEVDRCIEGQSGLRMHGLEFSLSASIESFLYHWRSTYELVKRFLIRFSRKILEKGMTETDIKTILEAEGE